MKEYGKLIDDKLFLLYGIPNVSDPDEKMAAEFAAKNGYKEVHRTKRSGTYYIQTWVEQADAIIETWYPMELEAAKNLAMDKIQFDLDNEVNKDAVVEIEQFPNGIVYNLNAILNAMGLVEGMAFIDAKDVVHILTEEDIIAIKFALTTHRANIYAAATERRIKVKDAKTVDELENI